MGMMINRRRVMGGKSLPYDAEIEYLESNGVDSQYIYLPFTVREGLDIYCRFLVVEPTDYGYIFGNQYNAAQYLIVRQFQTSGKIQVALAPSDAIINEQTQHLNQIRTVDVHLYDKEQVVSLDDIQLINKTLQYNSISNYHIMLWQVAASNYFKGKVRIYNFKLWLHQNLMADFIPVRVGNVGYMYDKVSGQLYGNNGTGAFILGADKTN